MKSLVTEAVMDNAHVFGAEPSLEFRESYPGVVNDDGMTALVERAARSLLGEEHVRVIGAPTMTTEDFGFFLFERPGAFYHIGAGCPVPLHSPAFLPSAEAVVTAAAVHAEVLTAFLSAPSAR